MKLNHENIVAKLIKTLHTYMFVAIPNDKKLIVDYYKGFVNEIQ